VSIVVYQPFDTAGKRLPSVGDANDSIVVLMTGAWVYCELPNMITSAPKLDSPKERLHQRIESALKSLTNTRSLKELFYDRLHYDRVSEPISTRRFSDSVRASLGDSEPLLLANGGVGGQFKVIYTRLSSQQIYKQEQGGMIESLLGIHPHSLFVFSNQAQDDWHFINAKYESPNPLGKGAKAGWINCRQRKYIMEGRSPGALRVRVLTQRKIESESNRSNQSSTRLSTS
jgi:hypothetical protein